MLTEFLLKAKKEGQRAGQQAVQQDFYEKDPRLRQFWRENSCPDNDSKQSRSYHHILIQYQTTETITNRDVKRKLLMH